MTAIMTTIMMTMKMTTKMTTKMMTKMTKMMMANDDRDTSDNDIKVMIFESHRRHRQ